MWNNVDMLKSYVQQYEYWNLYLAMDRIYIWKWILSFYYLRYETISRRDVNEFVYYIAHKMFNWKQEKQ